MPGGLKPLGCLVGKHFRAVTIPLGALSRTGAAWQALCRRVTLYMKPGSCTCARYRCHNHCSTGVTMRPSTLFLPSLFAVESTTQWWKDPLRTKPFLQPASCQMGSAWWEHVTIATQHCSGVAQNCTKVWWLRCKYQPPWFLPVHLQATRGTSHTLMLPAQLHTLLL